MIKNKFFYFSICLLSIFLLANLIFVVNAVEPVKPNIKITEDVIINELPLGNYRLKVTGTLEITNPSLISNIFEFNIPLELDALLGISSYSLDSTSANFGFTQDAIRYYFIKPTETVKTGYFIYGIINEDLYNKINSDGSTFLEYYSTDFKLYSNAIVNLQKPQREGYEFVTPSSPNSSYSNTPLNNTQRLISSEIRNPSDFEYFFTELHLYGSQSSNPMYDSEDLLATYNNISIQPYDLKIIDFFDVDSNDYSVYWVSYDFGVVHTYTRSLTRLYEDIESELQKDNSTGNRTYIIDPFIIKKSVDKTIVRSGDKFKVILRIVNMNDFSVYNLTMEEEIPNDYGVEDVSVQVKIGNGSKLSFDINTIDAYDTKIITYTLVNKDTLKGITFLKPAKVVHKNITYYSEGVLLINDILPEKKVFIQKQVEYIDDEYARITIKVKNLGSILLEDILITDIIDDNAIIKEISKVFQSKGVWRIKSLSPGGEWEVSYVIQRNANMATLPNIFGVDKTNVYGTLISSEEVITIFGEEPRTIEKVGMALAVGLLVFYLLF